MMAASREHFVRDVWAAKVDEKVIRLGEGEGFIGGPDCCLSPLSEAGMSR